MLVGGGGNSYWSEVHRLKGQEEQGESTVASHSLQPPTSGQQQAPLPNLCYQGETKELRENGGKEAETKGLADGFRVVGSKFAV